MELKWCGMLTTMLCSINKLTHSSTCQSNVVYRHIQHDMRHRSYAMGGGGGGGGGSQGKYACSYYTQSI